MQIIALQRGHLFTGRVRHDGPYLYITDVSQIEYWHADPDAHGRGIGRLARTGPQTHEGGDRINPCPDLGPIHEMTVVYLMDAPGWEK